MTNPGTKGEHILQEKFNLEKIGQAYYDNQELDRMKQRMIDYTPNQHTLFHAKADANGDCDCSLSAG